MTNEDIEKRIEFIIDQQALFSADMNLLKDSQSELTARVDGIAMNVDRLSAKIDTLAEIQAQAETRLSRVEESFVLLVQIARISDERLDDLTQKMGQLTEAQARTDNRLAELAEAQVHTEERLNALIDVVDRYINRGGNGNRRQE